MPAFTNAHHHIYSTLSKGIPCQLPLKDFEHALKNLWWTLDKTLAKDHVQLSTIITSRDSLLNGVTTVFDHHISCGFIENSLSEMAQILSDHEISGSLCFETSDRNGEEIFERSLKENLRFENEARDKNIKGMIGLHAAFTLSDKSLKKISEAIGKKSIHIHIAEGELDEIQSNKFYNMNVIERLNSFGLLNDRSFLVHCSNLNEKELEVISGKNLYIVQAVDSNMNNAQNIGKTSRFMKKNIRVLSGTDGMTSNMLKSWKNTFLVLKYLNQDPDTGFAEMNSLLHNSYNLKNSLGLSLGVFENEPADLVILDYEPATIFSNDTFLAHFIYGITESRVQYVIKNDKILVDNFSLTLPKETEQKYNKLLLNKLKISNDLFEKFKKNKGSY
jgi:cytosine/adenosine deaminase-related metal-dependent hydrolase